MFHVAGVISRGDAWERHGNAVPIVKVFKNAQERNAAVKDKETFIAQSSMLAFSSLLPSLQTTPFAKNNWKLAFNNWPLVIFDTDILVSSLTANKTVH